MHKLQKHFRHGYKMEGAIMMSNRTTKQECLAKKVFGLPPNMINFTERIKAGMLLFLFEHEERKLYGVFEATTDGAMNIMPNAFHSQRNLFPAQVLFQRVWMCRPLCEDEFRHVIMDNYYSPKKFNFGLSYDQVFKLVQLFYVRRINVKQNLNYVPNKIIRMFQKDDSNNIKRPRHFVKTLNRHLTYHEFQSHPKASQDASSLEISPLSENPISNADSSNAVDVSFTRYDSTDPTCTFIQESKNEKERYIYYDNMKEDKSDVNASNYVVYSGSEECSPSIVKSKLRSDIEDKRISVFSRLSMDSNAAMKRKSFSESSKELKKLECNTRKRSTSVFLIEKSVIDDSIAEARPTIKKIRETEERNSPEDGSEHAEAETKVVPCDESVCEKNSLPSECSPGKVASDDTEKGVGSRKIEVTSRNLLWFLQKTKDVKTSIC